MVAVGCVVVYGLELSTIYAMTVRGVVATVERVWATDAVTLRLWLDGRDPNAPMSLYDDPRRDVAYWDWRTGVARSEWPRVGFYWLASMTE